MPQSEPVKETLVWEEVRGEERRKKASHCSAVDISAISLEAYWKSPRAFLVWEQLSLQWKG